MKLYNFLSLNLYSSIGYFDMLLYLYLFITSELYERNCNVLDNFIYLSVYDLCSIYTILQAFAILFLICFFIEFIMCKLNIKTITINFDNIFYKILFYFGCAITSFGTVALITFYTLLLHSK